MLVRDAVKEYRYAILGLSARTQQEYLSKLMLFCTWCESQSPSITLEKLKQPTIRRFAQELLERTNPHTGKPIKAISRHGYFRVLKAFLHFCSREEGMEEMVSSQLADRIEMPKIETKVVEVFNSEQLKALFASCEQEQYRTLQIRDVAIPAVLADTGIRNSELICLTLDCCFLEPDDAYLKVHGKGDKWREVGPLGRNCLIALRRYVTRYRNPRGNQQEVFLSRDGKKLTVDGLDQIFTRLGNWAHITGVRCSPHTMRHGYAIAYLQAGGDIYRLSKLLGHSSVRISEKYLTAFSAKAARERSTSVLDGLKVR